jgi:hypothetical protein
MIKKMLDIQLHCNDDSGDKQIQNILKMYKTINEYFYYFAIYSSYNKFLKISYRKKFNLLEDIMNKKIPSKIKNTLLIKKIKNEFIILRKKYEQYRIELWGLDKWKKYLPLELVNYIDSYL